MYILNIHSYLNNPILQLTIQLCGGHTGDKNLVFIGPCQFSGFSKAFKNKHLKLIRTEQKPFRVWHEDAVLS